MPQSLHKVLIHGGLLVNDSILPIHTVVSGALDRLHYEKDPCVKYDVNRKLWIYLHRHRTEEEFERIHQAQAAAAKARKAVQKHKIPRFRNKEVVRTYTSAHVISNADNVALLNVDIPTVITTGQSHSPRGGTSPRTQGSPKACYAPNRVNYSLHAIPTPNQAEVKCTVLGIDGQSKKIEIINSDPLEPSSSNTHMVDNVLSSVASNISAQARDICNLRQSTIAPTLTFPCAKNIFGNLNATQIVSVTPVQIKPCPTDQIRAIGNLSSHVHDILNVDMKPSSPSFVGQPPVLQPILTHQNVENANSHSTITTSVTPTLISSIAPSVTQTKVNCANLSGLSTLSGFQTIVIKQDPGIRTCNGVSAIPVLSIEERPPSTNPSTINTAPVVARLLNGSQYLSFSNIVPSSNSCSSSNPIAGTVQNFRVQGGNLCPQVLSTSTIKVVHSAPVSAITDSRIPVISLKNQLSNVNEPPVIAQSPASLNVCGKVYQMANVRNTVISKDVEPNLSDVALPKEFTEIILKDGKGQDHVFPAFSIGNTLCTTVPITVPKGTTQTIIKDKLLRIVEAAAAIIRKDIQSSVIETKSYLPPSKMLDDVNQDIPKSLLHFLQEVIMKSRKGKIADLKQNAHQRYGAKRLIDGLYSLEFAALYGNTVQHKISAVYHPQPHILSSESEPTEQQVNAKDSRVKRENTDVSKLVECFTLHNPFPNTQQLVSLASGMVGNDQINCHKAHEIGLESLLLFQRITVSKQFECNPHEYLQYELSPYPTPLFDNDGMRKTTKAALYDSSRFRPQ
ncbi:nuclear factor related to kappa-B-binding protein [Trichonephila inaurata madagascariensis]|uniref:Nuclear factor related to kappa-B-binding protein n=1 Tax=Trichonephila inaurata madagascariensis TaxID=2747483 RepID=A0A8X7C5P5_9ARAC|nr:nuclear factor related to kappa-B-binding protein [Trichonephila inaurata madagascariensis]